MQKTRRAILDHLRRHPGATVDELAAATGTASITTRAHLGVLTEQELVRAAEVRGARGRPFRRYFLTAAAAEDYFPKHYDELAVSLMSGLTALEGRTALRALIEHVAGQMASRHRERVEGRPLDERVAAISSIIDERGGAAEWERTEDGYVIREHNCPYLTVSRHDDNVCELDRQMLSRLADASVEVPRRLRDGADSCVFLIRETGAPARPAPTKS